MKKNEVPAVILLFAGVIFFIFSIAMTGIGAMGFARDTSLAGWGAFGSFCAAVLSILAAAWCFPEEKEK